MFRDSGGAGQGGDGGFCHLLFPRDACSDMYHHSPCKRARHWAPPALAERGGGRQLAASCSGTRCSLIEDLPDECLFEILQRLTGNEERDAVSRVSKRWLTVLSGVRSKRYGDRSFDHVEGEDRMHWKEGEGGGGVTSDASITRSLGGNEATDLRMTAVSARANGFGGLRKLLILGQPGESAWKLTDAGITLVARGSPWLRELTISHAPFVTDEGLCEISRCCSNLEKIELSRCPMVTDEGLVAMANKCPHLSFLTIEHCPKIGDRGLQAIGRRCRNLHSVFVTGCPSVGDQGIANLVCSASSSLMKIKLQNLNISDVCLAVIGLYGKSITDLTLAALQNVNERGFWIMGNARGLRNLKSAVIAGCPGATDVVAEALGKGCPSLRKLCLRRCCHLSDVGIRALAGTAKMLEDLHLEECNRISAVGVLGALWDFGARLKALSLIKCMGIKDADAMPTLSADSSLCVSLHSLSVRDCPGFGDACLSRICKLCPSLMAIQLSGFLGVTDAGVLPLVQENGLRVGLVKVDLSGCANIVNDRVVSALLRAHGATLKVLNLEGCRKVSDDSLLGVVGSCYVLEDLDISKSLVTDVGVAALASSSLQLRVLSLSGCSMISADSLPFMKNIGRSLAGLNLMNCNKICESAARSLQKEMTWCDIIF